RSIAPNSPGGQRAASSTIRRLYAALKWRITGRPVTSGSGQPLIPLVAEPRSGAGENPASPLPCNSPVFTHLHLPALSFALLLPPGQLSHCSLTQRARHRRWIIWHSNATRSYRDGGTTMGRSISARCSNCFTTLITDLSGGPGASTRHWRRISGAVVSGCAR